MLTSSHLQVGEYQSGLQIAPLSHAEAYQMALAELNNFVALLQTLSEEDWLKPTYCALWNVRQMVAHVAGAQEGYLSFKHFKRQMISKELKPYAKQGLKMIDATNQLQVDDRKNSTPAELIAELKEIGPVAIHNRHNLPLILRAIRLYLPILGYNRIDYLTDLIYTRDMWMHRVDISKATGREMTLTPRHDGRITNFAVRDLAKLAFRKLKGNSVVYHLKGVAGGSWLIGQSLVAQATLEMDTLDFHLLAAGRYSAKEMLEQNLVKIEGNRALGQLALENTKVPY